MRTDVEILTDVFNANGKDLMSCITATPDAIELLKKAMNLYAESKTWIHADDKDNPPPKNIRLFAVSSSYGLCEAYFFDSGWSVPNIIYWMVMPARPVIRTFVKDDSFKPITHD